MSVSRKENGALVKKAGLGIIDNILNKFSNHAISNSAVSEGMALRNVTLYNGKLYQLNLDGTRGDEIEMGGVKRIFRDTFSFSSQTKAITLPYTVVPSKCDVTLYGNGYSNGNGTDNYVIDVINLTSTTLTVIVCSTSSAVASSVTFSYQIVEYN